MAPKKKKSKVQADSEIWAMSDDSAEYWGSDAEEKEWPVGDITDYSIDFDGEAQFVPFSLIFLGSANVAPCC